MADRALIKLHEDVPLFREAIAFTAAKTGFNAPVIEKDYFCTVLLWDFARHGGADLIFKGASRHTLGANSADGPDQRTVRRTRA